MQVVARCEAIVRVRSPHSASINSVRSGRSLPGVRPTGVASSLPQRCGYEVTLPRTAAVPDVRVMAAATRV